MTLMLQKELADRIISKPDSKTYGRLSVMCQAYANIKYNFRVSKSVFKPIPKVDSAVITFIPRDKKIPNTNCCWRVYVS